jgi:hypothetical protein
LDPVTGAVDQLDATHPRRRLRPHKIDRARRRIGTPIALPADEERRTSIVLPENRRNSAFRSGSE